MPRGRARRFLIEPVLLALFALVAAVVTLTACTDSASPSPTPEATPEASGTASVAARAGAGGDLDRRVRVAIEDVEVASRVRSLLEADGYVVDDGAGTVVSGSPSRDAIEVRVGSSALVVHPRSPLVDVTLEDTLGLTLVEGAADEVMERVAGDLEVVGLVPVRDLDLRVRALTVDGFDPYRDPADANPLATLLWVHGPAAEEIATALRGTAGALEALDPVGFLATGELIPARCVTDVVAGLEGGYGAIFDATRDLISAADLAMSHWEPAIIEGTPTPCTPTFNLSTQPEAAQAAREAGIDVALAVGNHLGDCWPGCGYQDAVTESLQHLEAAGLATVGAGADLEAARRPHVVEVDGVTFAFLAYDDISFEHYGATEDGPGTAHADAEGIAQDVRAASALADHVVVGFSWGVEYVALPSERQRALAHAAIEAGASLVVGNHPHWVQATERVGDAVVAYSLGNFVFDQDWSVETVQGAVLEVGFTAERILGVRLRPTAVRERYLVELLDPAEEEGAAVLRRMWDATDQLAASLAEALTEGVTEVAD